MNNKAKQTSGKIDPSKIVARIVKGFAFLNMDEAQQQEQRNFVAATVHSDFDTMSEKDFARKYIEWVPVEMSSKALGVSKDAVTKLIATASAHQPKGVLVPKRLKVLKAPESKAEEVQSQPAALEAPAPQPEAPSQESAQSQTSEPPQS